MPISKRCSAAVENHIQCEGEIPYLLMIYNDGFQSVFVNDHACSVQTLTHTHTPKPPQLIITNTFDCFPPTFKFRFYLVVLFVTR